MNANISASEQPTKGTYAFASLGCPKNLVDSERMLGLLQLDGYQLVADPDGADFVLVNTCGFIEAARRESFATIDEMLDLKARGRVRAVIVAGCLAERQRQALLVERPEIDQLVGVFARDEVTRVADRLLGHEHEQRGLFRPAPVRPLEDDQRLRITPRHYAYLKISEGCDRKCTFCAIPKMRGRHASKPLATVVAEAHALAADGVRELILVAQDTTYYGMDSDGRPRLVELLTALNEVDVDWIRLMYLYPMYMDDGLIETLATSRKIVPYIDLPLQHIDDRMLRRMARRVNRRETEQLLDRLRAGIPELTLRTTLITGFPGEGEPEFACLEQFVRDQQFDRLGVFAYSTEPDTPAAAFPDQVPEAKRHARRDRLMAIQQEIAFAKNQAMIGRTRHVLIDQAVAGQPGVWYARTTADAPEIDTVVYVTEQPGQRLATGQLIECEIVAVRDYDLVGVAVDGLD